MIRADSGEFWRLTSKPLRRYTVDRYRVTVENKQVSCSQDAASPNIDGATRTARSQKEEGLPLW